MKSVKIHQPKPTTTLPRHEQAARRECTRTQLPATPRKPRPQPVPAGTRQTAAAHELYPFGYPNEGRPIADLV